MTDPGPIEAIREQVRGVRRRRNVLALQDAAYRLGAAAAALAVVVVVAALRGGRVVFALALVTGASAGVAAAVSAGRTARRGWLARRAAPGWTDRAAGLQGRLATLLALRRPPATPFECLLLEQAAVRLPAFRPERVVPSIIPWRAFAAAGSASAALAAVLLAAPALRPPPPTLRVADRRIDFVARDPGGDVPTEVLVAPGTEQRSAEGESATGGGEDVTAAAEALADLSDSVQDWLRDALLGEAGWERGAPDRNGDSGGEPAGTRRSSRREAHDGPAAPGNGPPASGGTPAQADDPDAKSAPSATAPERIAPGDGDAGAGAGTGSDARLFGAAGDGDRAILERFELAIAARVRTRPGGALDPAGAAPGADPDRNPTLAGAQRPEDAAHRMPVPRAWQPVVGRLFAHAPSAPPAPRGNGAAP